MPAKKSAHSETTKVKLTKAEVERLRAPHSSGKPFIVWDTEQPGFGVWISGTKPARSFVAQVTLPATEKGGRRTAPRRTFGSVAGWFAAGKSLEQARGEAFNIIARLRAGDDPKRSEKPLPAMTVQQALDRYIEKKSGLRDKSKEEMRSVANRYLSDWLERPLRSITGDMVEDRHGEIQSEVAAREKDRQHAAAKRDQRRKQPSNRFRPPKGDTTIKRTGHHAADSAMVVLRALWNFAADRDASLKGEVNPVRRLRKMWYRPPTKQEWKRTRRVHGDQLPAFHKAVMALPNTTARDYILFLLFTGMRRREAASLKWTDVDFADNTIRVPAKRTKAGRELKLPMSDLVSDLLIARRAKGKDVDGYVFPADSEAGYIAEPRYPLGEVAKATGIYVSAHDLRRTFIGIAESTEMSAFALKALVNHAGGDITEGYLPEGVARLREPAQRVADRIKTLCNIEPPSGDKVKRLRRR